ncbi:transient receptor potential cation channel subfamily A member 1 isoform X2 [Coccinella septempunctata]|uniref:transient receptor potential cation channel subfamily A member 1 isoform X2 n=1 Tax=Coccinella septempunctata TaxID=41139 RepID=UPI001D0996B9|nr:transient receptor potential cation channel subfamily A member 1 isoform X2 [Coccinella septempunctata]
MISKMPTLATLIDTMRNWRLDADDVVTHLNPPTPIIQVSPRIQEPVKESSEISMDRLKSASSTGNVEIKTVRGNWSNLLWSLIAPRMLREESADVEAQKKLLKNKKKKNKQEEKKSEGGQSGEKTICMMAESPFRILKAAESGNLEIFQRLYFAEPTRLSIKDSRGRTVAHQAAYGNRVNILQFIHSQRGDLNNQDNAGNTPLHIAVENESLDAVDFLLKLGVRTDILNEKHQAVIHLTTELNKVKVLEVMGRHRSIINIELGGDHGRTALHIAAIYDHDECAKMLISTFGASPKNRCNNGYYPIHEAAKNASSKTLEVFLQWGEMNGTTRSEMISLPDAEGNIPLHSAVHGGDLKAVELCLKSGAKISTQQQDLSTPVHLACSQGATEIIKLMFKLQPEEKVACLKSCDVQKMTPLHCAAMFDHPEIVAFLIDEGADINCMDKEKRTPLLLAAVRGGWRTVHTLIKKGADINVKDVNRRNVLHLVVMNGGRLELFANEAQSHSSLQQLLNEKDVSGCAPLHYASREGHIRSLENLIRLGAVINLKNNNNESPLHFAARYGRFHTVKQLLDSEKGTFIINECDGEGLTPLHIASQHGHARIVQLLLNRGALLHRDHNGRNPLHLAAMNGFTQTMELLLSVHSHLLDQTDKDGNTALHLATMENKPNAISLLLSMECKLLHNSTELSAIDYAIYYKYPEAALAMVTHETRAKEVMLLKSYKHPCVTLALIASMPKVFESVQDKCITKANCKKDSKSFYIKYNFQCLQCPEFYADMDGKTGEALNIYRPIPLPALNAMVSHGRVELLAHPLSQKYLQMKWNSYGKYFHCVNVIFYSFFLGFVTCFSAQLMTRHGDDRRNSTQNETLNIEQSMQDLLDVEISTVIYVSALGILGCLGLGVIKEGIQVYQQKWMYLLDPINLVTWILYVAAMVMALPIFGGEFHDLHFSCASIVVFLSWFNLLLLLQRFDQVGIYVVMFLEILQTLIKVLMVFSILIIAFGLAFYILLSKGHHLSFKTIPMSLARTFSMMLGEIDFLGTYVKPYYLTVNEEKSFLPFPIPSFFILGIFMVLMPILLMNLLIGLAVGDIESVRRNAQLKRLAMQVVLHTELESKLPKMILEKVDKVELIEYPNDTKHELGLWESIFRKWFGDPFSDEAMDVVGVDNTEDYLVTEISKTKKRLKELAYALETQQQFLRLIVQKMEIKTEAEDVDEGVSTNEMNSAQTASHKWTSPKIRKKLGSVLNFNKSL